MKKKYQKLGIQQPGCTFCGEKEMGTVFTSALKKGEVRIIPMSPEYEEYKRFVSSMIEQGWEETVICEDCLV